MTPENTEYEMSLCMFPADINPEGIVFGGAIQSNMDKTAYVIGKKFTRSGNVLVAMISSINIPTYVGNVLTIKGRVVHVETHSMIIELMLQKENLKNGQKTEIGKSFAVLVHVDKSGVKSRLPQTLDLTNKQKKRGKEIKKMLEELRVKSKIL